MTSIASPLDSKQMDSKQNGPALDRDAFRAALMAKGAYYHIHHPYQVDMAQGRSTALGSASSGS